MTLKYSDIIYGCYPSIWTLSASPDPRQILADAKRAEKRINTKRGFQSKKPLSKPSTIK